MNSPIQITSFSAQTLLKYSIFRKLVLFSVLHTNFNPLVKNSESPPIRGLVQDHIQISRFIGLIVITQREVLYKSAFLVQKRNCTRCCLLGVRRVARIWQKLFVKQCTRCWFWVYKIKDKENLKRVAWGLDVGHEDRIRIKSLVFAFAYFLRFIFFLASYFI